jgi:hypothetical protein
MDIVTIIAGALVVVLGLGVALAAGRKHRRERHEVETFFSTDPDQQAWWEERH